jgi:LPXTG-motif cell wall-anchored protein
VTQFTAPITLSFTVDTDKVDNGDNVKVYYYDTTDKNWVLVGGTYANGVVTTTTDHFTTFAAFDSSKEQPILEEELPNTATNMYNMIAIGLVLTLLGGVLLYRKKQVA